MKNRFTSRVALLLLFNFLSCFVFAQFHWDTIATYNTGDNGLIGNDVKCAFQDDQGNIWFGTYDGISKYNGTTWVSYNTGNSPLPSNYVNKITQDKNGNMLFVMYGQGITKFDGSSWTNYTMSDGLFSDKINCIMNIDSTLWIGSEEGLMIWKKGAPWSVLTEINSELPSKRINALMQDDSGYVWIGTADGAVKYNRAANQWTHYSTGEGLPHSTIYDIFQDSEGSIWFGTHCGLARLKDDTIAVFKIIDNDTIGSAMRVHQDIQGNIWVQSCDMIEMYNGDNWYFYKACDSVGAYMIYNSMVDQEGFVWIATSHGVHRLNNDYSWTSYTTMTGLATNHDITTIYRDKTGNHWFASYYKGASKFDDENWTQFNYYTGLKSNSVNDIYQDKNNNYWFATYGGVVKYDGIEYEYYKKYPNQLASNSVMVVYEAANGAMLFGTDGAGVCFLKDGKWTTYDTADGLINNWVVSIYQDKAGNYWFGTAEGVSKFDGVSTWTTYPSNRDEVVEFGDLGYWVYSIFQDGQDNFWFATRYGITRFNGAGVWKRFSTADGLSNDWINRAVYDPIRGWIWCATKDGVSRYNGTSWAFFKQEDGLVGNNVQEVFVDMVEKKYYFGTEAGVSILEIKKTIIDFSADGQNTDLGESILFTSEVEEIQPTSYLWDFGDGQRSTSQNASHAYQMPGKYCVTLTVIGTMTEDKSIIQDTLFNRKINYVEINEPSDNSFFSLSNLKETDTLVYDISGGYIPGHNILFIDNYADLMINKNTTTLLNYVLLPVAVINSNEISDTAYLNLKVWNLNSNGMPGNELLSQKVYYKNLSLGYNLIEIENPIVLPDTFYIGFELKYNQGDVLFSTYYTADRNVIKSQSNKKLLEIDTNNTFVHTGLFLSNEWFANTGEARSMGLQPVFGDAPASSGMNKINTDCSIKIHPNPCSDYVLISNLSFENNKKTEVYIYTMEGKKVNIPSIIVNDEIMLNTSVLKKGIYFIEVISSGKINSHAKIVRL